MPFFPPIGMNLNVGMRNVCSFSNSSHLIFQQKQAKPVYLLQTHMNKVFSLHCQWMRSSRVVRAAESQCRQLSWVRSQHPPTQWNLRGGS
jgi:hypothetical protein